MMDEEDEHTQMGKKDKGKKDETSINGHF
ncbi:hypothetical protein KIPB_016750, partial [Kipferlia bialata]|eukprot:g16750.t1